jgi:hypothetical protein
MLMPIKLDKLNFIFVLKASENSKHQKPNLKLFGRPIDRLTVLSRVERLTTLSRVEGQSPITKFKITTRVSVVVVSNDRHRQTKIRQAT